jgi:PilZ domain
MGHLSQVTNRRNWGAYGTRTIFTGKSTKFPSVYLDSLRISRIRVETGNVFGISELSCVGSERAFEEPRLAMVAKSLERSTTPVEVNRSAEPGRGIHPERRQRVRTSVHWPVLLFRSQRADAVESLTLDLSVSGFYCLSATPFAIGESLVGVLKMPAHNPNGRETECHLECRVQVVRVDANVAEGQFGVACRIEDYRFARP